MGSIHNWLDRFCYKHPKLAIPNLMLYIIAGNVFVFILDMFSMNSFYSISSYLYFDRAAILGGQIWRIISFVFVPTDSSIFFFAISMYFYYFIARMLEGQWGSTKFTVYYGIGVIMNILVGFLVGYTDVVYMNMALFFAFATMFGETRVLLFFILPIKIKWLAYISGAFFLYQIISLLTSGYPLLALIPIAAILNYFLFFGAALLGSTKSAGQHFAYTQTRQRQQRKRQSGGDAVNFQSAQDHVKEKKGYLHKCAVCGRTDVTDPQLDFRYCSKCNGYYCYCEDHIHTHVHIE